LTELSSYLEVIGRDLDAAARREAERRRRRRPLRTAALIVAGVVVLTGTALAGSSLLGGLAPKPIQATLDAYWPDDGETMAPAPGHAVVVAEFGDDILYRKPARDGKSICTEITALGATGKAEIPDAGCAADTGDPHWPLGVLGVGFCGRQLVVGQARGPAGASLHLVMARSDARIPLGVDGFSLWELPQQERTPDTAPDVMSVTVGALELRAADGSLVARMPFQAMLTPPPSAG
jgi:hypothetical protein